MFFVDDLRQASGGGRLQQGAELRPRLDACEALEAGECRGFIDEGGNRVRRACHGLQGLGKQGGFDIGASRGMAFDPCRAQGPFIDLGGQEQLIDGRRDRERCAACMRACNGAVLLPSQVRAGPLRARAPGIEQGVVEGCADDLEYRAGGREE